MTNAAFRESLHGEKNGAHPGAPDDERKKKANAGAVSIRLTPADNTDRSVVSNYVTISPMPGMVFLDFGFLEPALLSAFRHLAREGDALPEVLNGKLAARVAVGYELALNLHKQLTQVLSGLQPGEEHKQP